MVPRGTLTQGLKMKSYDYKKSITKGISGGIRGAIFGGGACLSVGADPIQTVVSSLVCTLGGFLYSAIKNWLKNN